MGIHKLPHPRLHQIVDGQIHGVENPWTGRPDDLAAQVARAQINLGVTDAIGIVRKMGQYLDHSATQGDVDRDQTAALRLRLRGNRIAPIDEPECVSPRRQYQIHRSRCQKRIPFGVRQETQRNDEIRTSRAQTLRRQFARANRGIDLQTHRPMGAQCVCRQQADEPNAESAGLPNDAGFDAAQRYAVSQGDIAEHQGKAMAPGVVGQAGQSKIEVGPAGGKQIHAKERQ